ncbi:MAG TPA: serine/threonine-protein kinase [Polyangia bacterium]|nr:serine/threonine-protein kinase [Polyangia bacterium]
MITLLNQTIGNYKVIKLLGEGGMGAVYLAEHPVIGRKVAIKVLHISLARDPEIVARFFNEARAIHTIGHQNIVEILDFGQTPEGQPYFIMEYLSGESLNDRIARGPMAPMEVADIANQICRALSAAHAKGVVHRDLKPHNVHVSAEEDGTLVVKLLDFGVAKILGAAESGGQSVKTRTGSLMGTPLYMSPEQCRGSGTLDHRTDIYSLGVMIYEMLAGRPPFNAEGVGELFAKHMLEPPPPLLDVAPETPPVMAAVVMKALAKELEQRYPTMEAFRVALVNGASGVKVPTIMRTAVTRPTGTTPRPPVQQSTTLSAASSEIEDDLAVPKRRSGVAVGALALVAAGVLAVVFLRKPSPEPAAPAPAPVAANPAPTTPPAPTPPPAPATVTIRMEASPAGVHVFRASDDADLGPVPVQEKLPKSPDRSAYVFKLTGYKDQSLSVEHNSDHTLHAALEKEIAPAPTTAAIREEAKLAATRKTTAPPRRAARRTRVSPDEDGLATPSF